MMPRLLVLLLVLFGGSARAGEGLDVGEWLAKPGVRLVVVEFYATWCKPCMKAVPRWRELHDKYRDRGLRLIVVSVLDPSGSCQNPGWRPDAIICDDEGVLAKQFGVGSRLPSAFLWSWRGALLVRNGHVDAVQVAVEEELARLPRIALDPSVPEGMRAPLRRELELSGKLVVVEGPEEAEAREEMRRNLSEEGLSDTAETECEIGMPLSRNSLLQAALEETGGAARIGFMLMSTATGCLNAFSFVDWDPARLDRVASVAAARLVEGLRIDLEMPGNQAPSPPPPPLLVSPAVPSREEPEVRASPVMPTEPAVPVQGVTISKSKTPLVRQWWFWTALAAGAVGVGVGAWLIDDALDTGGPNGGTIHVIW